MRECEYTTNDKQYRVAVERAPFDAEPTIRECLERLIKLQKEIGAHIYIGGFERVAIGGGQYELIDDATKTIERELAARAVPSDEEAPGLWDDYKRAETAERQEEPRRKLDRYFAAKRKGEP